MSRWRNRLWYIANAPIAFRNWWAWPLPKLGIGITLKLRNGLLYHVRPGTSDLAVLNEASIRNPYLGTGYIKLSQDAVVVDVGANIGDFTVQVAALCPHGRVYAVEPVAENVEMIARNRELNRLSNIYILQVALGASEGHIGINVAGNESSAYFGADGGKTENVRLTTLGRLMMENKIGRIDLLKLDCEGAEWDILPSSIDILPRIRQICMELHLFRGRTAERLATWLREQGYEVTHTPTEWTGILWAVRPRSVKTCYVPGPNELCLGFVKPSSIL